MQMPFGKYRGCDIDEIPEEYLKWVWSNVELHGQLKTAVKTVLRLYTIREDERGSSVVMVLEPGKIKTVYRELSRKYHPDHGGDHLAMCAVNDFYSRLLEA
jgi:Putative quorum-sensing-regulated virulence factor